MTRVLQSWLFCGATSFASAASIAQLIDAWLNVSLSLLQNATLSPAADAFFKLLLRLNESGEFPLGV
jgi:hypothetical protein